MICACYFKWSCDCMLVAGNLFPAQHTFWLIIVELASIFWQYRELKISGNLRKKGWLGKWKNKRPIWALILCFTAAVWILQVRQLSALNNPKVIPYICVTGSTKSSTNSPKFQFICFARRPAVFELQAILRQSTEWPSTPHPCPTILLSYYVWGDLKVANFQSIFFYRATSCSQVHPFLDMCIKWPPPPQKKKKNVGTKHAKRAKLPHTTVQG